jgi:predicted nucleic acid-binding protein
MTSSSSSPLERGLDAMLIVYSLLDGHPASTVCEQFIRARTGWFTTAIGLLEAKAVLTKVYAVDAAFASRKLAQLAVGPLSVVPVDAAIGLAAMDLADALHIDLTDGALLHAARAHGARWIATDDSRLAQACRSVGCTPETPIDVGLRRRISEWEDANLPAKGLARLLHRVHRWLGESHPEAALDFWSQTGAGSHLP